MATPLYLLSFYDVLFPEDDCVVELSKAEYDTLAAACDKRYGFSGDFPATVAGLIEECRDRGPADRRPSEIAAAEAADTVIACRLDA